MREDSRNPSVDWAVDLEAEFISREGPTASLALPCVCSSREKDLMAEAEVSERCLQKELAVQTAAAASFVPGYELSRWGLRL